MVKLLVGPGQGKSSRRPLRRNSPSPNSVVDPASGDYAMVFATFDGSPRFLRQFSPTVADN